MPASGRWREPAGATRRRAVAGARAPVPVGLSAVGSTLLAVALTLTSALSAAPAAAATAPAAAATAPPGIRVVPDGTGGLTAGMALGDVGPAEARTELARFRADGANSVSIFVWWIVRGRSADTLSRYGGTLSDADLVEEIRQAEADHLAVSLTPVFYCLGCQGGWRGTVAPADLSAFFAHYRAFVDHYASLAQQTGVTTFYAGSEMTSLETDTSGWDAVIAGVRRRFRGQVAYEENWDVLGRATFLDRVDLIGVSAYFPLDDAPAPNLARLLSDWTASRSEVAAGSDWVAELSALAAHTGKPLVFGEAGYMSGDYAARQPFLDFEGQADWLLQSDLYQALLETFSGRSWWRGVVWWQWYPPTAGGTGSGRTPQGKTAEALLRDWYLRGWRARDPAQPIPLLASSGARRRASSGPARIQSLSPAAALTVPALVAAPEEGARGPLGRHRQDEVALLGSVALLVLVGVGAGLALARF